MRHDRGLAASPPVRYMLEVERSGHSPFPCLPGEVVRSVQPRQLSRVPDQVDPGDPPVLQHEAHCGLLAVDLEAARGRAVEPHGLNGAGRVLLLLVAAVGEQLASGDEAAQV